MIGHIKRLHRMDRNHLAGRIGDAINPVLDAVCYNFRRFLTWLRLLLSVLCISRFAASQPAHVTQAA